MKKCKVIHINDGTASILENGNYRFVEEFKFTESYLNDLLNKGWEVKHMVPEVTPAIQGDGSYSFYKSGYTFYLEREEHDSNCKADNGADTVVEVVDFNDIEFDDDFIAGFFTSDGEAENS